MVAVCGNSPRNICDRYFSTENTFRFVPPSVRSHLINKGTVVAVHDMKAYAGSSGVVPLILNPEI